MGIDLEAFALLRSLAAPTERGAAAMVAVAIGHDRSTFAVTDGRVCEFTRVLEWGGWSLNVALARALDAAPLEVELAKCSLSLDDNSVEGLTPEQSAIALDAVRRQLQSFARELVSSLQFYQNQPGSLAIGSIVITGGTAHMPGLAQELQRLIGVHVEIGNPLARVRMSKRIVQPEQLGSVLLAEIVVPRRLNGFRFRRVGVEIGGKAAPAWARGSRIRSTARTWFMTMFGHRLDTCRCAP